jgi:alkylation response protein AidB-like acyl-CoA dehydrogenase
MTALLDRVSTVQFELSDDQVALRDAARALLGARAGHERVRAVVDAGGGVDGELWRAMVDQGWTALLVDEERGGLGLGPVEAAVLCEELGAHLAPAPILQHLLALAMVPGELEGPTVDGLRQGDLIGCAAFEPVGWRSTEGGPVVSGVTEPVVFAPSADLACVRVIDDEQEEGLCFVVLDDLDVTAEPAMDLTREVGWLRFDQTAALAIGGAVEARRYLDLGAMLYAAELLGLSQAALDLTVAYAKEREQFGRPIGSFQAVKHRCADMLVDVEGMRSTVYYAAWAIGAGDRDASIAASTAKTWCSDAAKRVMASALQVHGGIGFTWEHDVHLFLKRAQLDQVSFGDARFHRARLAGLLRSRVEAGESVI